MDEKLNKIPKEDANWMEIQEFSLSFNGYDYWGSFEKAADIANQHYNRYEKDNIISNNMEVLRTSLFFEQRRYRHFGSDPGPETMKYLRKIIKKIKELVK
ncbi:hypothetical protein [Halanaerobium hydrogeniformans]|uniref:Uncharacterized protein n=1 Tax=Halanaerobium hydrogeniformans TaxID=656519 RepID=E4RMF9_HALHG|nr:hypothetical protein [Halanaerobium hydrogeniformans]ADQ14490.1 hypothetical protein Halsa_1052 [Halanaerobium hydrogeniformans]